jgi:hypothetical protein
LALTAYVAPTHTHTVARARTRLTWLAARAQTAVRLRIKLSFAANGQPFEDTGDVSNIPVV